MKKKPGIPTLYKNKINKIIKFLIVLKSKLKIYPVIKIY